MLGRALEIGEAEIEALKGDYENSDLFSDAEKAAIRWAEVLTLKQYHGAPGEPPRSAAAMDALKEHYNEAQIVEITGSKQPEDAVGVAPEESDA